MRIGLTRLLTGLWFAAWQTDCSMNRLIIKKYNYMNQQYFSEMLPVLADRARLSAIGDLAFANVPLQRFLSEVFSRSYGEPGAFLADPTFEAVFGWKKGD